MSKSEEKMLWMLPPNPGLLNLADIKWTARKPTIAQALYPNLKSNEPTKGAAQGSTQAKGNLDGK
jgi:hypothetical protein